MPEPVIPILDPKEFNTFIFMGSTEIKSMSTLRAISTYGKGDSIEMIKTIISAMQEQPELEDILRAALQAKDQGYGLKKVVNNN